MGLLKGEFIMKAKLAAQALLKFLAGLLICGALIFLPAGTLNFFGGWLFMGVLFIPMLIMGIVLIIKAPSLLEKRLNSKEEQPEQKKVVLLGAAMFILGFILAAVCYRFELLLLPKWLSIAAAVLFLLGYAMYAEVMRENAYLSRTVEVQKDQKVIDTGLYGIIRHPMYTATILMFLSIPLILGSVVAIAAFITYPFLIVLRIDNEEMVLRHDLKGYTEYQSKVKYRLIPFIW